MGVQNLWLLLAPVGRQIEIEALAGQVLAVDASIWLTQFIKAMRDDEGQMLRHAHVLGTFHRVAKLLFYRIRPVFVFDGQTPELKRRTVARRRRRQEHQAANLRQTAQRILLNRLKLYREELKKGKPAPTPAVDPNFVIPGAPIVSEASRSADQQDEETKEETIVLVSSEDDEGDGKSTNKDAGGRCVDAPVTTLGLVGAEESKRDEETKEDAGEEDASSLTLDDFDLDTSRLSRVDLEAVFALPPHLQKDMIQRIQRDRRQEVRDQFIPLAGNPEAYSRTQISSFLATSKLNQRIEKARQKNAQQELEKAVNESAEGRVAVIGVGKRIASNSDRFFVYEKGSTHREDSGNEHTIDVAATDPVGTTLEGQGVPAGRDDHDEIFDRIHGRNRRRNPFGEDNVVIKRTMTDFSIGTMKDFTTEMEKSQRRKLAVEEARTRLLEKQKYEPKEEPLAIENSRTERSGDSKIHEPVTTTDVTNPITSKLASHVPVTITIDRESFGVFEKKLKAITSDPVSTEPEIVDCTGQSDSDGMEWETVPVPAGSTINRNIAETTDISEEVSDEGDIMWEQVSNGAANAFPLGNPPNGEQSNSSIVEIVNTETVTAKNVGADGGEITTVVTSSSNGNGVTIAGDEGSTFESAITVDNSDEEDAIDELYSSLKGEMDEEESEQDLEALKQEALQSAISTASNLTQWAAGAVRRALAAHTKSESPSIAIPCPSDEPDQRSGERQRILVDASESIESPHHLHEEGISQEQGPKSDNANDQVGIFPHPGSDDDQMLQSAILESMQESDQPQGASRRYLQYTTSTIEGGEFDAASLENEQNELKKLRNRQMRDVEGVNDEMVQDVMELLRLFGVPFLVCPMEAEAQCAALEQLGLVDGIITDDSDIFPFGGKKVYKNIFHNQKFVEAFFSDDIKRELGFTQDEMISMALLLGSDYTDGVRGIGIVNATEVVTAYPGVDGLKEFKSWVQSFDLAEEALARNERKKSQAEIDEMKPRDRFQYTHSKARRKWELGDEFPNPVVVQAYKNPQVDRSDARFTWALPDLAGLRAYCTKTFGWNQSKTDSVLLPLMGQIARFANSRHVQTRIDSFFTRYEDNVKYAAIRSKRLRVAVKEKTLAADVDRNKESICSSNESPQRPKKRKYTKTKKTTSTLGL